MNCARCGSENNAVRKFCTSCGAPLGVVCNRCGVVNEPDAHHCGSCGFALVASLTRDTESRGPGTNAGHATPIQYTVVDIEELLILRKRILREEDSSAQLRQADIDKVFGEDQP